MKRLSKKHISVLLLTTSKWIKEKEITENIDCDYKTLWMLDLYGLIEARARILPGYYVKHNHGFMPSQCQWKITREGSRLKKKLKKEGWHLAY